jgi:uncharacterized integral membrane protein
MRKSPIGLLLIAAILLAIVGQNLSPSLALTFLGMQTIALPLGVWVALSVAAGIITSGGISILLRLVSPPRPAKSRQTRSRPEPTPIKPEHQEPWDEGLDVRPDYEPAKRREPLVETVEYPEDRSPMEEGRVKQQWKSDSEEWDDEEWQTGEPRRSDFSPRPAYEANAPSFEVKQAPTEVYRQGSVYGYSYRTDETNEPDIPEVEAIPEPEPTEPPIDMLEQGRYEFDRDESNARSSSDREDLPPRLENPPPTKSTEDDWRNKRNLDDEDW